MAVTTFGLKQFGESERAALAPFLSPSKLALLEYYRGLEDIDFAKDTCYIYTGRGPSYSAFHLGHLPGLQLCLQLQQHFKTRIEFMIADDEKMFRDGIDRKTMTDNVVATLEQLAAIGFNETNTHFRINSSGILAEEYETLISMMRVISVHTLTSIFGEKKNLGEYFYPLIQILPSLSSSRKCIVIAGIDQDPFFRLARELARRFGFHPPTIFYTRSVPGLDGSEKMSTSVPESMPIFLGESLEELAAKVGRIRKVGAGSLDELFEKGANLDEDVPYKLLDLFDDNRANVALLARAYTIGLQNEKDVTELLTIVPKKGVRERDSKHMLTSYGIRQYLIEVLSHIVCSF